MSAIATRSSPIGDAGPSQFSETFTVKADGTVAGTLKGGSTTTMACAYTCTATKQ